MNREGLGMWLIRAAAWPALGGMLAACGGGGSSTYTAGVHAAVTTTQSNATGTLTVRYPAGFAVVRKGLSSNKKHAAYVNPTAGNVLDIYVDGTLTAGSPYAVAATPDSTQLINNIPLYSSNSNNIMVFEYDSNAHELAYGTSGPNSINPGSTNPLGVTLNMNATSIGVTTQPATGSDALLIDTSQNFYNSYATHLSLPTPFCLAGSSPLYAFAADPSAGFVLPGTPAGSGGLATPTLVSASSPGTSRFGAQQLGFAMTFDGGNDPVNALFTQTNPLTGSPIYGTVQFFQSADCTQASVVYVDVSNYGPPSPYVPDNLPPASYTAFPVIAYQGFTYYPLSDINNDEDFYLLKFDSQYNLISVTPLGGDRYISTITVNTVAGSVTFEGQNDAGITLTYAQLMAL